MLALPYATQLLALLGAEVIKVEPPGGEGGRAARPLVPMPDGGTIGATFARGNLNKSSLVLDLKNPAGRALFLDLVREVDVVAENMRPGVMDRLGVGYADVAAVAPRVVYLSVSGFGNTTPSPYRTWPAYAPVAEAMAGLYEIAREPGLPPRPGIAGALDDLSAALFAAIGVLAALRHREVTGVGQYVDIAMFDSMLAMNDMAAQLWSLGLPPYVAGGRGTGIMATFRAADGYFLISVIREHQLARLTATVGRPDWSTDPRLSDRGQWSEHVEDLFRPAIEEWAGSRTRLRVVEQLAAAGIPAAPCNTMDDLVNDPHVQSHRMLVELPSAEGRTTLMPGNPIKMSRVGEGPLTMFPAAGQDTERLLTSLLDLKASEVDRLRDAGAFGPA